ncbi:unnamed protein product [Symbiodinium natans]|uniref:Uncharacterized protein n=1 Tax=Symbiodinium natans TaxID=878477 RepID=A0A812TXD4_9DINO|nr:unnamed protein product [Symbiodinium natans]
MELFEWMVFLMCASMLQASPCSVLQECNSGSTSTFLCLEFFYAKCQLQAAYQQSQKYSRSCAMLFSARWETEVRRFAVMAPCSWRTEMSLGLFIFSLTHMSSSAFRAIGHLGAYCGAAMQAGTLMRSPAVSVAICEITESGAFDGNGSGEAMGYEADKAGQPSLRATAIVKLYAKLPVPEDVHAAARALSCLTRNHRMTQAPKLLVTEKQYRQSDCDRRRYLQLEESFVTLEDAEVVLCLDHRFEVHPWTDLDSVGSIDSTVEDRQVLILQAEHLLDSSTVQSDCDWRRYLQLEESFVTLEDAEVVLCLDHRFEVHPWTDLDSVGSIDSTVEDRQVLILQAEHLLDSSTVQSDCDRRRYSQLEDSFVTLEATRDHKNELSEANSNLQELLQEPKGRGPDDADLAYQLTKIWIDKLDADVLRMVKFSSRGKVQDGRSAEPEHQIGGRVKIHVCEVELGHKTELSEEKNRHALVIYSSFALHGRWMQRNASRFRPALTSLFRRWSVIRCVWTRSCMRSQRTGPLQKFSAPSCFWRRARDTSKRSASKRRSDSDKRLGGLSGGSFAAVPSVSGPCGESFGNMQQGLPGWWLVEHGRCQGPSCTSDGAFAHTLDDGQVVKEVIRWSMTSHEANDLKVWVLHLAKWGDLSRPASIVSFAQTNVALFNALRAARKEKCEEVRKNFEKTTFAGLPAHQKICQSQWWRMEEAKRAKRDHFPEVKEMNYTLVRDQVMHCLGFDSAVCRAGLCATRRISCGCSRCREQWGSASWASWSCCCSHRKSPSGELISLCSYWHVHHSLGYEGGWMYWPRC